MRVKQGMLRNMQKHQSANERVGRAVSRYRSGMSQAELARQLAERLGKDSMDPTTITRIEGGKRSVTVDELEAFADIFGVGINDLLVDTDVGTRLDMLFADIGVLANLARDLHLARTRLWNAAEELRSAVFDERLRDKELVQQLDAEQLASIEEELRTSQERLNGIRDVHWPSGVRDDGTTYKITLDGTPT